MGATGAAGVGAFGGAGGCSEGLRVNGEMGSAGTAAAGGAALGVTARAGALALGGSGAAANETPRPRSSKGLLMSAGTSICLWFLRRASRAGSRRGRISPSGSATRASSLLVFSANSCGAAFRSSPKVILTLPVEIWLNARSVEMDSVASPTSVERTKRFSSIGRPLRTAASEISMEPFAPFGCATGFRTGALGILVAALAGTGDGAGLAA